MYSYRGNHRDRHFTTTKGARHLTGLRIKLSRDVTVPDLLDFLGELQDFFAQQTLLDQGTLPPEGLKLTLPAGAALDIVFPAPLAGTLAETFGALAREMSDADVNLAAL